jgi:membrane protein DedA with SNARE-associated domain
MSSLTEWTTQILDAISSGNLLAMLGFIPIAAIMEIGMPIPFVLDSTLLFVGLHTGFISFPMLLIVIILFIGRFMGASILYWLGRLLGSVFIKWFKKRSPKISDGIAHMSDRLNRPTPPLVAGVRLTSRLLPLLYATFRVPAVIVVARFTPGLLTVSSVAAGGIGVNYGAFVLGIVLSSIIGDILVLGVGFITEHGLTILGITPPIWQLVIGIVILNYLVWSIFFLVRRRRRKQAK